MNGPLFIPDQPTHRLAGLRNDPLYSARNAMRQIPFHRPSIGPEEEHEVIDSSALGMDHHRPQGQALRNRIRGLCRREARARGLALHRRAASGAVGARHRTRRRSYHHAVHLYRHRRGDGLPRARGRSSSILTPAPSTSIPRGSKKRSKAASIAASARSCRCTSPGTPATWIASSRSRARHNLKIVEDAAHAVGSARHHGRPRDDADRHHRRPHLLQLLRDQEHHQRRGRR